MIDTEGRVALCATSCVFKKYAQLRYFASNNEILAWTSLHSKGPIGAAPSSLYHKRAYSLATALLLIDFRIGGLIRYLCGVYMHDHIPLNHIREAIVSVWDFMSPTGCLIQDFDKVMHIIEHGAPTSVSYKCSRRDILERNLYDNYDTIREHISVVLHKIVSGAANRFLLVFPRWIWWYIYGFFVSNRISPMEIERVHCCRFIDVCFICGQLWSTQRPDGQHSYGSSLMVST